MSIRHVSPAAGSAIASTAGPGGAACWGAARSERVTPAANHSTLPDDARPAGLRGQALAIRLVAWSAWFGILTGYLELVNLGFKKYVLGRLLLLGEHTLWLAPLADGALFLLLGAMLVPLAMLGPARLARRAAFFVFAFVLAASLVLLHREIHNYAAALLAAGVAVQSARFLDARVSAFDRLVRRTLPSMIAAVLASAITVPAVGWWRERRAVRALPAVRRESPNVLLIVWDTVRAESLSTYGYERDTTPHLSALAEEAIVFERAVTTSPWTLPSHASLFTGRWAHELSANWNVPLDDAYPTLAEVLRSRGYATAGFVANQHYCSRVQGLGRGFLHYEDFNEVTAEFVLSAQITRRLVESSRLRRLTGWKDYWGRKPAATIDRRFLRWLAARPDRPFFALLNYYDAHQPYRPPPPFDERYGPSEWREGVRFRAALRHAAPMDTYSLTPRQSQGEQDAYDGSIAYLDACLGRLLDELDARGVLDDTLVIVTSDHGEHFGEHGLRDHGNSLYRSLIHVPLVIRFPGGQLSGVRVPQVVSLRDLPATVLDLIGCEDGNVLPGSSLRRCWKETEPAGSSAQPAFASLRPPAGSDDPEQHLDAVIDSGFHYVAFGDGREALFDFLDDPGEAHDLSGAETMQETLARLRALVAEQSSERTDQPASTGDRKFDP